MRLIYFFILLFFSSSLSAQNLAEAELLADSAEFLIYEDMNLELAQQLNEQALAVFVREKNFDGQAHCQVNRAVFWMQKDSFALGLELLKPLIVDIPSKIPVDSRLAGLIQTARAWSLWGLARYAEAYEVAVEACQILRKQQDWERFVDASLLATYSIYFNSKSNFSAIDEHIEETYQVANQYFPPSRLVFKYIHQLYGSILYQQGRVNQALHITHEGLDYQYKLLTTRHLYQDSITVAKYYNNLGRMYAEEGDIEQSISYYKNAYLMYQKLHKPLDLIKTCTRLGELYLQMGKKEEADPDLLFHA